ncbi:MAG: SDR family NAD(P)-dependent oxidoreductase [Alphaproteobacteria bacterium]|nr:SDR family NAD(P)-dependent oxidoreductase [Alphaproteobacteria bacterium]MBF0250038.1 SDR family NAD(P)-dependent oxidoreductase [Alphaproteobacteria bacterium]
MNGPLSGKMAMVTGASGGVGLVAARALAQTGCGVYVMGRNFVATEQAASDIRSDYGVEAEAHTGNPANPADADVLALAGSDAEFFFNCAGNVPRGSLDDITDEAWRKSWESAVFGPLNLVREMAGHMGDEGRGLIVLVIDAPEAPLAGDICASAAGAALRAVVQALSQTLPQGVRILGLITGREVPDPGRLSFAFTRLALEPGRFATGSLLSVADIDTDE